MDRGAWQATVHRVTKESDRTWQLSNILVEARMLKQLAYKDSDSLRSSNYVQKKNYYYPFF